MLLRILIIVFAFNAFIPTAFAVKGMADKSGMDMMKSSQMVMQNSIVDMDCGMIDKTDCLMTHCGAKCVPSIIPIALFEAQSFFSAERDNHPQRAFTYFYTISLPVNTPPPLV